jgi:ketosteroid isomerase-like protein
MAKYLTALLFILLTALSLTVTAQVFATNDGRDADRAAIRAHIESIFQAFIDKDREKLRATHAEDWKGFLEGSRSVMKGNDSYMNAVEGGIKNKDSGMTGYKITEFDVTFEGEVAIVCFVSDVTRKSGSAVYNSKLRIMDIYGKRNGKWIQIATDTNIHPQAMAEQQQMPGKISDEMRKWVLDEREKVWRAWFANDTTALNKLIPEDAIAIDGGDEGFQNRAAILAGAKQFADSGGKLVSVEFPRTDIQLYGDTVIIYTTYKIETEFSGKRNTISGRATENFVIRNGNLVNVGWHLEDKK